MKLHNMKRLHALKMLADDKWQKISHNRTKSPVSNIALLTYLTRLWGILRITERNRNPALISHCTTDSQWRTEGGGQTPSRNSEGPPKSCQTQPNYENC